MSTHREDQWFQCAVSIQGIFCLKIEEISLRKAGEGRLFLMVRQTQAVAMFLQFREREL